MTVELPPEHQQEKNKFTEMIQRSIAAGPLRLLCESMGPETEDESSYESTSDTTS